MKRRREAFHDDEKESRLIPEIPTTVLTTHLLPFLDRKTWNNLSMASRELREVTSSLVPPWPTKISLGPGVLLHSLLFSPDGNHIVCSTKIGTVYVLHQRTGFLAVLDVQHDDFEAADVKSQYSCCYSSNGQLMACSLLGKHPIRLWSNGFTRKRTFHEYGEHIMAYTICCDDRCLASVDRTGRIWFWQIEDGTLTRTIRISDHKLFAAEFAPGGTALVFSDRSGILRLFNLKSSFESTSRLVELGPAKRGHHKLAFSTDGQLLIMYRPYSDSTFDIWNLSQSKMHPRVLRRNEKAIFSLAFWPGGRHVAIGCASGHIQLWNLTEDKCDDFIDFENMDLEIDDAITRLAVSPDGRTIAAAGLADVAGRIRFWYSRAKMGA